MSEQLEPVVDNKHSEKETQEQILNQKFSIEGYNVAIFYTKKMPKVDAKEVPSKDRYITIKIMNEQTGITEELNPIRMIDEKEIGIEPGDDDIYPDSGIDIIDLDHALKAVDQYLYEQRHQTIDHNLAKLALAA